MAQLNIHYNFNLLDHEKVEFDINIDDGSLEIITMPGDAPEWTLLENNQCPHCPLDSKQQPSCPVAVSLANVIERFHKVISYDQVDLEVVTVDRTVSQSTTVQRGLGSLIGLLIATSGCPHTAYFKPMARFHLPMSTEEDTIFRAVGSYLIAQYYINEQGGQCDLALDGLNKIYDDMHVVNSYLAKRIRCATETDSSLNAVILLDMFTNLMPYVIEEKLDDIRHLFEAYLR